MEKSLEQLSASKLRALLIEEVKSFIHDLECASSQQLSEKRKRLISISNKKKYPGTRPKLSFFCLIG